MQVFALVLALLVLSCRNPLDRVPLVVGSCGSESEQEDQEQEEEDDEDEDEDEDTEPQDESWDSGWSWGEEDDTGD